MDSTAKPVRLLPGQAVLGIDDVDRVMLAKLLIPIDSLLKEKFFKSQRVRVRTLNVLIEKRIGFVGDLVQRSPDKLLSMIGFGQDSLGGVQNCLTSAGLGLGLRFSDELKGKFEYQKRLMLLSRQAYHW